MKSEYIQIGASIYEYLNPEDKTRASLVANCVTEEQTKRIVVASNNFEALVHALDEVTPAFNVARILMDAQESRDMAGDMVKDYRALLDKIKRELSI